MASQAASQDAPAGAGRPPDESVGAETMLAPPAGAPRDGFWPGDWWRLMDSRVGTIPVPVSAVLVVLIGGFMWTCVIRPDILTMAAAPAVGGFACAELGKRLPVVRNVGAAAIFAIFNTCGHIG